MTTHSIEQLRAAIHSYFREVGYNGCELIFNELVRHGGIVPILTKLGIKDPGNSDDQYVCILNYIRRFGVDAFAGKMGTGVWEPEKTPRKSSPEDSHTDGPSRGAPMRAAARVPEVKGGTGSKPQKFDRVRAKMPEAAPRPDPQAPAPEPEVRRQPTTMREIPEKSSASTAPSAPKGAPGGVNADGTWDGVTERRSGQERRSGKERRGSVDVVFKNKRYGGDRRNSERRKNWPPKTWPLPRDEKGRIVND